jgi:signal transduction histidine kinase/FixJ family two-component response regulator
VKIIAAALSVLVLIAVLTWLSLRAFNSGAETLDLVRSDLDRFNTIEADLHANILSARAGLLRNYDPVVRDTDTLDLLMQRMQASLVNDRSAQTAIERLDAFVRRQEELTEEFKSNNALLQNSLASFALLSAHMSAADQAAPLAAEVSGLAVTMLQLTLDTDPASVGAVQNRLDDLARRMPPTEKISAAVALLAHGRLLWELLPATDQLLRALDGLSRMRSQDAVRTWLLTRQLKMRTTARWSRSLLYVISLLLLGLLVHVGRLLQLRARTLRRRAAFEHVLSGISMRFVTAHGPDLHPIVEQALAEMAACLGADRAYFVASRAGKQTITWHQPGIPFPPHWPDGALGLLRRYSYPAFDRVVHVSNIARLPPDAAKDALAAVGLTGWACVTSRTIDGAEMLLGFDAVARPTRITPRCDLGLLRMALDTIVNALGRQTLEQERTRLEARLEQARRLETVGTLASGIAHNFNNIVGAILGYIEYANEQDCASNVLDEIRKAGERARDLVDRILGFARRHDGQRRIVSVAAVVEEAMSLLRASLPASVELAVDNVPDSLMVRGVPAHLHQVILNLCNNAAQAMDHTGCIELNIAAADLPKPHALSHGMLAAGRYVRIVVSDSGRGMDRSVLARLFEPFFTTRATGTGLGLATIRDIVREHGGAMHVESTVDVGTRFEAWLACLDAASPSANPTLPRGHGETVLLLERDGSQRLRDEEILAALGYEPVGYSDGADALDACQASPQRFDLILLAYPFAAAEMLAIAEQLRQAVPDVPVLLATSSADAISAKELMRVGVSDVLPWPIAAAETIVALQDSLQRTARRAVEPVALHDRTGIVAAIKADRHGS